MLLNYKKITTLEEAATLALADVDGNGGKIIHAIFPYEISKSDLSSSLSDVNEQAQLWRQSSVPESLVINHGSFIGDGLEHIKVTLKENRSSRRALYSLINQRDISRTGDHPIPSFMIFQCLIDRDVLYVSVYFRALEVSNFLRINLEEIRLNLLDILAEIGGVDIIRLSIFAFDAYSKPGQMPLTKCNIDRVPSVEFCSLVQNKEELIKLLNEKSIESSYINLEPFEHLISVFQSDRLKKTIEAQYDIEAMLRQLRSVLGSYSRLKQLKCSYSSDQKAVNVQHELYCTEVRKLISLIQLEKG